MQQKAARQCSIDSWLRRLLDMSKNKINSRLDHFFSDFNNGNNDLDHSHKTSSGLIYSWETDANGQYTACGAEIIGILGISPSEVIGHPFISFMLLPEDQTKLRQTLENNDFPCEIELRFISKDFLPILTRCNLYQRFNEQHELIGYHGFTQLLSTTTENLTLQNHSSEDLTDPKFEKNQPSPLSEASNFEPSSPLQGTQPLASLDIGISDSDLQTEPQSDHSKKIEVVASQSKRSKKSVPKARVIKPKEQLPIPSSSEVIKLTQTTPLTPFPPIAPAPVLTGSTRSQSFSGISLFEDKFASAGSPWTKLAHNSYLENQIISSSSNPENPAVLASPLLMRDQKTGVIEIVDETPDRKWTEEDRLLVHEISNQLGLALENAQLYSAIQVELNERVKAEGETLRRNKDLATLNQIGQRLSRLVGREEIFEIVSTMTQQIFDVKNILVSLYDTETDSLSFPVCISDGEKVEVSSRPAQDGFQEKVISSKSPLIIKNKAAKFLTESTIDHPKNIPLSMLAVPLLTGDRAIGVITVLDYEKENSFDQVQAELLSTVASQAATSLENANLFTEIRNALEIIEVRERIQSNVTNAVAALSEKGSKEILFLLESLSKASRCESIFYAESEDALTEEAFWIVKSIFISPELNLDLDKKAIVKLPISEFPNWFSELNTNGWFACTIDSATEPEKTFLDSQSIKSVLLLSIKLENKPTGFIALENFISAHDWRREEIEVLRIASDSFNNTLIRERLLSQLQISLDETENLYSASHKLALANNTQEMVSAVVTGINISAINRGVLVLFDYNDKNQVNRMTVEANYYNGSGTPPPAVGTEYLTSLYESIFVAKDPVFFDDLLDIQIEHSLQDILTRQNIRSMAALPLWSGNTQIGVFLLQSGQEHHFTGQEIRSYPPLTDQMATAIQNLRLFEKTQSALSETELLYNVSSGIAKSTTLDELVSLVGKNVMPKHADTLWLCTASTNQRTSALDYELIGSYSDQGTYTPLGERIDPTTFSFVNYTAALPITFYDVSKTNFPQSTQATFQNKSLASAGIIPLQIASNPVGLLIAGSRRSVEFETEDLHTLQIVGNSIAVAIERQRLLSEAQRRALELQAAAEIARDTTSTLAFDILLSRIVNLLKDRFDYYHCSIFLLDDLNTYAVVQESTGEAGIELKRRNHKLAVGSQSVIGTCTSTGEIVLVNDVSSSSIYYANPLLPETRSELGLPLKISGRVIGALDIQSRELNAFSENELTVLQILTDQISVAIENARAYALSQEAVEEMREIDRVKSQFLANMSHELRTPLNSVIGFSRVILKGIDGPINDVQEQDITAIYNSGMHLLNMINEILDLSKIEAGKMELQLEETNLSDVINEAITTATGLIKDKPLELIQKTPADLPLVKVDETRIGQVVLNLISNAVKFTDKGSITIEASLVTSTTNKHEIQVTVTDTGIGIAPEDQSRLFQRFSQVDDSPTRKTGGTGLGLSICRSLVELHGGKIGLLSSQVGKGSVFYFTLPLPDYVKGLDINQLTHGENVILAIDDDPQVISLYERFLRTHGYEVIALTDPSMAVERAKELHPFAITLDIMMPQKDGWQVLQELKQDEATRNIPILVCSILEEEEKGFSLGASEYLVKPFLQDDLINAIHRLNRGGDVHEVLVIDDDPDDLRLVQKMMGDTGGFHATLAQGGEQALEILQSLTPDVILLDLFMPSINGFDLLEIFKTEPRYSRIPIIILTGADLNSDQQKQLSEFSNTFLTKGLLKEKDLLQNLEEALEKIKPHQKQD
jgi:signal transduction histidine kinase/CheY-like chemotaxis protein